MNERPILTQDFKNPAVMGSAAPSAARVGNLYTTTTGAITQAALSFLVLQVTNPASSTRTLYISQLFAGTSGNATFDIFRNATFAAAGTALTPRNTNFADTDASVATAKFISATVDPTTGGQLLASLVQTTGAVVALDGRVIVPPGNSILLRGTNNVLSLTISLSLEWWEA